MNDDDDEPNECERVEVWTNGGILVWHHYRVTPAGVVAIGTDGAPVFDRGNRIATVLRHALAAAGFAFEPGEATLALVVECGDAVIPKQIAHYFEAGADEVWIVDAAAHGGVVYVRGEVERGLPWPTASGWVGADDEIEPLAFPGVRVRVADLLGP